MKTSKLLMGLCWLTAVLALVSSGMALFWDNPGGRFIFTSMRGQEVEIYGQGLYRYDPVFTAGTFLGTDFITIFLCVPLLVASIFLYRSGSIKGKLLMASLLSFFVYNASSLGFGASYNILFPIYILFFSASLFALILALTSIDVQSLPSQILPGMPTRGIGIFMIVSGIILTLVWFSDLIPAIIQNQPPAALFTYTTVVTYILDLGIITPLLFITGFLLFRRAPMGYVLAAIMLILCGIVGLMVISQTVAQMRLGITLSMAQLIIFVISFVGMSLVAFYFALSLLRNLAEKGSAQPDNSFPTKAG